MEHTTTNNTAMTVPAMAPPDKPDLELDDVPVPLVVKDAPPPGVWVGAIVWAAAPGKAVTADRDSIKN